MGKTRAKKVIRKPLERVHSIGPKHLKAAKGIRNSFYNFNILLIENHRPDRGIEKDQ